MSKIAATLLADFTAATLPTEAAPKNVTYRGYTLHIDPSFTDFGSRICYIKQGGLTIGRAVGAKPEVAIEAAKRLVDYNLGEESPAPKIMSKYGLLDALNDLADIQFVDNTWDEGQTAKAEVTKIIKALCNER